MTERDEPPAPPRAPRRPTVLRHVIGGTPDPRVDERTDDWYWLRERDDPAVREYLEAENAFARAMVKEKHTGMTPPQRSYDKSNPLIT